MYLGAIITCGSVLNCCNISVTVEACVCYPLLHVSHVRHLFQASWIPLKADEGHCCHTLSPHHARCWKSLSSEAAIEATVSKLLLSKAGSFCLLLFDVWGISFSLYIHGAMQVLLWNEKGLRENMACCVEALVWRQMFDFVWMFFWPSLSLCFSEENNVQ